MENLGISCIGALPSKQDVEGSNPFARFPARSRIETRSLACGPAEPHEPAERRTSVAFPDPGP